MLTGITSINSTYSIQSFNKSPGIYFEYLRDLQFYNDDQHVITYINLDSQDKKYNFIFNFFKMTEDLCKSISEKFGDNTTRVQQSSLSQLKRDISDLNIEKEKLHELLGHSSINRVKRGWFNIVGKFAKELFGTMDTEDAEYIDHKLNDFDSNESQLISLIKEQSHVVRTTIVNFNNTSNYLNQNLDALVSNIAGITKSLDLVNSNTLLLEIEIKFDEHLIFLTHLINTLKNEYSSLINSVLLAKRGILHPSIMSPTQLCQNLKNISHLVPPGLEFPIPFEKENSYLLLNVIDLVSYFYKNKLVFKIIIPLLPQYLFDVYNSIPVPVKMANHTYIFISPNQNKLISRKDKQMYTYMTEAELGNCKRLLKTFICRQTQPLKSYHTNKCCELTLLLPHTNTIPDECEKRIAKLKTDIWSKLENKNSWIFVLHQSITITVICDNNHSNVTNVPLNGEGILSLSDNCKGYTGEIMLIPSKTYYSKIDQNFTPDIDICETICNDDNISKLNLTLIDIKNIRHISSLNVDELKLASFKLEEIENLANQINFKKYIPSNNSVMLYTSITLSVIIVSYIIYRCYCPCNSSRNCCKMLPSISVRVNNNQISRSPTPERFELQAIEQAPLEDNPVDQQRAPSRRYATRLYVRNLSRQQDRSS